MAEQSLDVSSPVKQDKRLLTLLKGAMALFVIGLLLAGRADTAWPIVTWPMYSGYADGPPGTEAQTWQLYAVDHDGKIYRFWEQELYGALPSGDGGRILDTAFAATGPEQTAAFKAILRHLQTLLPNVEIDRVEYWQYRWEQVDGSKSPPFDIEHPDERQMLGSFRAADLEAAS